MKNNEDEESEDAFIHTPEDYVPTDDETNDETKDVDEEEYKRISEELYGDVNVRLTDVEQDNEGEEDAEKSQVDQEAGIDQAEVAAQAQVATQATQIATTELPLVSSSRFVSSTFTNAMLNLENLNDDKTKAISLLNITVQHEAPQATNSAVVVPESETLFAIHQRITDLEKDVKELKSVDNSTTFISAIKFEVLNAVKEYLESSLDDALYKVFQKHSADIIKEHSVPAEISILEDEDAMDKGTETSKKTSATKDSSKGNSPSTFSKSSKYGKSTKDQVVEPISVQHSDNVEQDDADYANMPMDQGEDSGNTDEQPNDETVPKNDWYKKSSSDTSPDP
ncbi:hypothetical protein Tco_0128526 [Tanacetum coccineum]